MGIAADEAVRLSAAPKSLMVMRMLDGFAGDDLVEAAVRQYLGTPGPKSLEGLYKVIRRSKPALPEWRLARSWFLEVGHPLVESEVVEGNVLHLRQSGFAVYPDRPLENQHSYRDRIEELIASPALSATTREEIKSYYSEEDRATLRTLGHQIGPWLHARGYL